MPTATADDTTSGVVAAPTHIADRRVHDAPHPPPGGVRAPGVVGVDDGVSRRVRRPGRLLDRPLRGAGWVEEFYLAPAHHLTYADFDWVRPLPGPLMYAHMATARGARCGDHRRLSDPPRRGSVRGRLRLRRADRRRAVPQPLLVHDARRGHAGDRAAAARDGTVPAITVWALRGQIAVVYVFAGIAKLNPDWLFEAQPMRLWLAARTDRPVVGSWLDEPIVAIRVQLGRCVVRPDDRRLAAVAALAAVSPTSPSSSSTSPRRCSSRSASSRG